MRDSAARTRFGMLGSTNPTDAPDPRIHVTVEHLRKFAGQARALSFLPRQPARSVLNGRHASRFRGRGLNFEELRGYLPGDDVRSIDWKVTARTGTPYIRVFSEERDRPALLVVDQRMSMFFGSQRNMKSVSAAEAAALAAFRILDQGDRVGGVVFGDEVICEIRPRRGNRAVDQLLTAIAEANALLKADAPSDLSCPLNRPLEAVAKIARQNHVIIIFSDFDGVDDKTEVLLGGLAQHNDLLVCLVTDPLSDRIPEDLRMVVSDGALQAELDVGTEVTRRALSDFMEGRLARISGWTRRHGIPVLPLSAGEDTVTQLRRLMGHSQRTR